MGSAASKRGKRSSEARKRRRNIYNSKRNLLRKQAGSSRQQTDLRPASRGREANHMAPASDIQVGTFNCRTLTSPGRLSELTKLASQSGLAVVAIQEHRRVFDSPVDFVDAGKGWKCWFSTARAGGHGGIGFLLSPAAYAALLNVQTHHHRVASISIQLIDKRLNIINCHMPTACDGHAAETADCIDCIATKHKTYATRDINIIAGDFNADLPPDGLIVKNQHRYRHKVITSQHMDIISDFIVSCELSACNGVARQRQRALITFFGPRNRKCRLDYVLIPTNRLRTLRRVRTIRPTCVRSDHAMVICTLNMQLWRPTHHVGQPRPTYWLALKDDTTRQRFVEEITQQVDNQTDYQAYVEAVNHAAEAVLPKRTSKRQMCLWDNDAQVKEARERLLLSSRNEQSAEKIRILQQQLEDTYKRRREEILQEQAQEVTQHHEAGRSRCVWKVIDSITGRKTRAASIVATDSIEERMEKIRDYFSELLNSPVSVPTSQSLTQPNDIQPLPMQTGHVRIEELRMACKATARNKAAGPDGIPSDVARIISVSRLLLPTMNAILDGRDPPDEWRQSTIVAIPKKGNSTLLSNQRGLSLMSVNAKLFNRILLSRLRNSLNEVLLGLQAGFRPNRCTVEQIISLRIAIDACRARKRNLCIVFADFSKAYDCVSRRVLEKILSFYKVPDSIIRAIMSLYTNTKARVRTSNGLTREFPTTSGVLQGDTLAPYLFVIVMDYIMRMSLTDEDAYTVKCRMSRREPAVKLPALAYADDAALMSDSAEAAERQLHRFETISASVGLRLNAMKTEVMHVGDHARPTIHTINGAALAECEDFCYLGIHVANNISAFKTRRKLAWVAARRLSLVWESTASDDAKVSLFRACVESVLLYGGEALTITDTLAKVVDGAHRALLRYALGYRYPAVISNSALYKQAKAVAASKILQRRRLALYGHVLRRPDLPMAKCLKNAATEPFRRGGHLRHTYQAQVEGDLATIGLTTNTASAVAVSRQTWRKIVK